MCAFTSIRHLGLLSLSAKMRNIGGILRLTSGLQSKWSSTPMTLCSALSRQPMSTQSKYETLNVTCEDGLRIITFNRPDKKNAISEKMFAETAAALKEAADDPNTLVTATTGAGNVYTAGNDLKNFLQLSVPEIADLLIGYFSAFIDFPKPLVAVINGAAVGAGTTLLPMYDVVYATERALFFTPFSSLGIVAEGCSTYTFPMVMGPAKAAELLMFEKRIKAPEACKLGLVTEVFPDSSFQEQVWPRVRAMTKLPPKSLMYSKQLCRDVHRAKLHEVNIAESSRVAERLAYRLWPDREDYKKFASSLPPLPVQVDEEM